MHSVRIPERIHSDNMIPLFENRRSGELESHLGNLEYRTKRTLNG